MDSGPLYCAHGLCGLLLELLVSFSRARQINANRVQSTFNVYHIQRLEDCTSCFALHYQWRSHICSREEDERRGQEKWKSQSIAVVDRSCSSVGHHTIVLFGEHLLCSARISSSPSPTSFFAFSSFSKCLNASSLSPSTRRTGFPMSVQSCRGRKSACTRLVKNFSFTDLFPPLFNSLLQFRQT